MLHHNRMSYRRLVTLLLAAVMLVALISACGKKEEGTSGAGAGTVIATYKGGELKDTEFDKYAAYAALMSPEQAMYMSIPQFKEQFVKQYIVTKEMIKGVSEEDKKTAKTQGEAFKTQLETAMKEQAELKQHMEDNDLSVAEAVSFLEDQVAFQAFYSAKGEELKPGVTDEEIKTEFEKAPTDYNIVSVRHILIGTLDPSTGEELKSDEEALKVANEVKAKLENGGDWTALAKEYSTDAGSKDNGGLYEKQAAGGWVAEFKQAANTQEIGKIGEPVKTEFGYHVMKVESREEVTYDKLPQETKDKLIVTISTTKVNDFLTAEQDKLEIKVTLPEEPTESAPSSPSASPEASSSPEASPSPSASASAK
jgi:foldase protein PrsA